MSLKNKINNKMFVKIILIFSIISIISISLLALFITSYNSNTIKNNLLNENRTHLNKLKFFFEEKTYFTNNLVGIIYLDDTLNFHIKYLLEHGQKEYINYSIHEFSKSQYFTPKNLQSYFRNCFYQDSTLDQIYIYSSLNDILYVTNSNGFRTSQQSSSEKQLQSLLKSKEIDKSGVYVSQDGDTIDYSFIYTINNKLSSQKYGYICFTYSSNNLISLVKDFDYQKNFFVVFSSMGDIVFNSSPNDVTSYYPYLVNATEQVVLDDYYVNLCSPNNNPNFTIAGFVPRQLVKSNIYSVNKTIILLACLLISAMIIICIFSILKFSKRIEDVILAMNQVKDGDLSIRIPLQKTDDEISQISKTFNMMCNELSNYIDRCYLAQLKQKDAEFLSLQAQINPHFLYNTLEVIRMKAVAKNEREIGEMVYILATLFKYSIKKEMILTISEELEHCKLYLRLFEIRYKDLLSYEINMEQSILHYSIINLTLQPIIENYILHGFRNDRSDNLITIRGYEKDDLITIEITDNGRGIEEHALNQIRKLLHSSANKDKRTIGLTNIHERLKIIYGEKYGIKIHSEINEGTKITIEIPRLKRELVIRHV